MLRRKDRKLGIAEGQRKYDLPLNKTQGSDFLIVLIALMTFLSVMAITTTFILNDLTAQWSSGLENKLTIEIPRQDKQGEFITDEKIKSITEKLSLALNESPAVLDYQILSDEEIQDLVSPWLGESENWENVPLPALISLQMDNNNKNAINTLKNKVQQVAPNVNLDTHQDWLNDILHLTGSLQFAAGFITLMIIITILIAVIGAIKSRMAIHHSDIELLHLMGASDYYISKQFQRYATILGLQGGALGVFGSAILLLILSTLIQGWGNSGLSALPVINIGWIQVAIIFSIPIFMCALCSLTARLTVMRSLSSMP